MNETATDKWRAEELTWEAIGSAMGVYGMLDLACQQLPRPHGEKHKKVLEDALLDILRRPTVEKIHFLRDRAHLLRNSLDFYGDRVGYYDGVRAAINGFDSTLFPETALARREPSTD
ncbi:hypothetical protein GCM10017783_22520 [Deinococcus piscis]|uniref:Uncharacterized protein n=1 Tax=Deinococcus piscis TaxID=394230 RepID=A0ABQ3K9B6_9DEIO|nr:hypothetical protein [Deinococcus piscis]GHG09454.1 hypothetical protein GCM10017783_22520 [Deinococcus piscis]